MLSIQLSGLKWRRYSCQVSFIYKTFPLITWLEHFTEQFMTNTDDNKGNTNLSYSWYVTKQLKSTNSRLTMWQRTYCTCRHLFLPHFKVNIVYLCGRTFGFNWSKMIHAWKSMCVQLGKRINFSFHSQMQIKIYVSTSKVHIHNY